LLSVAKHYDFDLEIPWEQLDKKQQDIILFGSHGESITISSINEKGSYRNQSQVFEGIVNTLERRYFETESNHVKEELAKFQNNKKCPDCKGSRLRKEALAINVGTHNLAEISDWQLRQCHDYFSTLTLTGNKQEIDLNSSEFFD
jgi:excinuclease ABC subunit A